VQAVVEAERAALEPAGTGLALRLEDALIPVCDLGRLLGRDSPGQPGGPVARLVIVRGDTRVLGLEVPRVVGERELVHRPPDRFLGDTPLVLGTAILEEGQPVLIVNVSELCARVRGPVGTAASLPILAPPGPKASILVVEDSELTRDVLHQFLRERDYLVLEAANGRDALQRVAQSRPDLVITDLEMPVLDGFELIRQLRQGPETKEIPIIVLSTRGSEADRQRAASLGADAYLVKATFREEALIELLGRFLAHGRA
jgi:CheY-like chemotaxis protein